MQINMWSVRQALYAVYAVSVLLTAAQIHSGSRAAATTASPETSSVFRPLSTTADSGEKQQRDTIRCVIYNELSSDRCRTVVGSETSEDDEIKAGCTKLESFKNLVTILGCTQKDYNLLHSVACTWDGTVTCRDYFHEQLALIDSVKSQLKLSCNESISAVQNEDPKVYCDNFLKAKDNIKSTCDPTDLASIEKVLCCTGLACFDNTDTSTHHGLVLHTIRTLSPSCARTMEVAVDELSKPPTEACVFLEKTKPTLLVGKVCSDDDYAYLETVVCHDGNNTCTPGSTAAGCTTTTPDPFASEKDQRDKIQKVIQELNQTCQDFMKEQVVASVSDPLEKTCKTFLDNYGFIVIGGQCSPLEYSQLREAICRSGITVANVALVIISFLTVVLKTVL